MYEGGMISYSLYKNACGAENLCNITMLDIAACLFGFSVFIGLIDLQENGKRPSVKGILKDAVRRPALIGVVIGVIFGASGIMETFLTTGAGQVYGSIESLIVSALTPMILIVIGYDMCFDKKYLQLGAKTIGIRIVIQAVLAIPTYMIVCALFPDNELMKLAIIIYMIAPPSYSMPAYVKSEEGSRYISTTNSIYCLITVVLYAITVATLM